MAREVLFETQVLTDFVYMEGLGYVVQISPAPFTLTVGETYVIVLEGEEYTRTAYAFDSFAEGTVAVGNDYPVTGDADPDNLPVIVGYQPSENYIAFVSLTSTSDMEIGIYKEVADEVPVANTVVLKDRNGTDVQHPGVEQIQVITADGGTKNFVPSDSVPVSVEKTIDPDFSAGDMVVMPEDGQVFSGVTVTKPENLKPENIPVGINIAGVDGAREEASGGGGNTPWVLRSVYVSALRQVTSSTSLYIQCVARLPLQSTIIDIVVGEHGIYTSSTAAGQSVYFSSFNSNNLKNPSNYTIKIKDYETYKGVSIDYSIVINNTAKQKLGIGGLVVLFTIPGLYYTTNVDGTIDLFADNSLVALPMYDAMPNLANNIDLSNSSITSIPTECFRSASCKKLILPSTITTIEANGLKGILEDSNATIDFSRATAVPTKADTVTAAATVLVPAALYSQWTSATNWSGNIVAV